MSIVLLSFLPIASIALLYPPAIFGGRRQFNPAAAWTDGVLWLVIILAPWIELLAIVLAAGVLLSQIRARSWIWHAMVLLVTLADLALLVMAGQAIGQLEASAGTFARRWRGDGLRTSW